MNKVNKLPNAQVEKNKMKSKAKLNSMSKAVKGKLGKEEVLAQLNKVTEAYQVPEGYGKFTWPKKFNELTGQELAMYKMIVNDISQQPDLVNITYWYFFANDKTTLDLREFWSNSYDDLNHWRYDLERINNLIKKYQNYKEYSLKDYQIPFGLYANKDFSSYIVTMPLADDKYTGSFVGAFISPKSINPKFQNALLKLFGLIDSLPDSTSDEYYTSLLNATDESDENFMNSGTQL